MYKYIHVVIEIYTHICFIFLKQITYTFKLVTKILNYKLKSFEEYVIYITYITIGEFGIQFIIRDILENFCDGNRISFIKQPLPCFSNSS